jgi:hypothetical protein
MEDLAYINSLIDEYWTSRVRAVDIDAEEAFDRAKVASFPFFVEILVEPFNIIGGRGTNQEIIDINCDDYIVIWGVNDEYAFVSVRFLEV